MGISIRNHKILRIRDIIALSNNTGDTPARGEKTWD
nr:MAG TPA: hypothetical protein [Caudoviricetes sp.]